MPDELGEWNGTVQEAEMVEADPEVEITEETPTEEQVTETAETTDETSSEPDPWAQYRGENGLIHGKYATVEDVVRAAAEADRVIAQRTFEARQAQEMLERFNPQQRQAAFDPMTLEPLLKVPPATLLNNEPFIRFGESNGVEWLADDEGNVDMFHPLNIANIQFVRELARDKVAETRAEQTQRTQRAEQIEQQFYSAYPELSGFQDIVNQATADLQYEGRLTGDFKANAAAIATRAKSVAMQAAAKLMGTAGGTAAAAARTNPVSPLGGSARGGGGAAVVVDETKW